MQSGGYDERRGPVALEVLAAVAGLTIVAVAAAFGWQMGRRAERSEALAEKTSPTDDVGTGDDGQSAGQKPKSADIAPEQSGEEPTDSRSLLFIGNSHCQYVPGALGALARAFGTAVDTEQLAPKGAHLFEHSKNAKTLRAIERRRWEFVVLQEQSVVSAVPELRQTEMLVAVRRLSKLIRKTGAKPLLFLTWARKDGDQENAQRYPDDTFDKMQARVIAGYREVARSTGIGLVPVGAAWQTVMQERSDIELFASDGLHASEAGVHLAAAVFLASLFSLDPAEVMESKAPDVPGLSRQQLRYLRQVAKKTVESFQR